MSDEDRRAAIDRKWQWMMEDDEPHVRRVSTRLSTEPVLRALFPFTSVGLLFRFSTTTEWPYTVLPWLETDPGDDNQFEVRLPGGHPVAGQVFARGTLEEMLPVLVREVEAALAREPRLFRH